MHVCMARTLLLAQGISLTAEKKETRDLVMIITRLTVLVQSYLQLDMP